MIRMSRKRDFSLVRAGVLGLLILAACTIEARADSVPLVSDVASANAR